MRLTNTSLNDPPVVGNALIKLSQLEELLKAKPSRVSISATVASTMDEMERRNTKEYLI